MLSKHLGGTAKRENGETVPGMGEHRDLSFYSKFLLKYYLYVTGMPQCSDSGGAAANGALLCEPFKILLSLYLTVIFQWKYLLEEKGLIVELEEYQPWNKNI